MKFKEYLKHYHLYCARHILTGNCDSFFVWNYKQHYYAKPHQCAKCKQIKMLVYNDRVCADCERQQWQDLYAKIEAMYSKDNSKSLITHEEAKQSNLFPNVIWHTSIFYFIRLIYLCL